MDKETFAAVQAYTKELLEIQEKGFKSSLQMFVDTFNAELKAIRSDVNDLKSSLQFSQKDIDDSKVKISKIESGIVSNVQSLEDALQEGLDELEAKHDYLENQSRRNNVKVFGIPEEKGETWDQCEEKVKEAISNHLGIEKNELAIERAHRVGRYGGRPKNARGLRGRSSPHNQQDQPRPMVAKFIN